MEKRILSFMMVFLISMVGCNEPAEGQSLDSPKEFQSFIEKNPDAQIIDVRTPEEYANGSIEGSVLINFYDSDFKDRVQKLDKSKPVMVYCAAGGRSGKASKMLVSEGFTNVHDLKGGMGAWTSQGMPVKNQ